MATSDKHSIPSMSAISSSSQDDGVVSKSSKVDVGRRPKILLAVTGSVAAIKGPELAVRLVLEQDAVVRILLSRGGQNFWGDKAATYNPYYWNLLQSMLCCDKEDDEHRTLISIYCERDVITVVNKAINPLK